MKTEFPLLSTAVTNGGAELLSPNMKLIEIQEASDAYWLDTNDVWDFKKDFGPFIPPYNVMWLEATARYPAVGDMQISPRTAFRVECGPADHPAMRAKFGREPAGAKWMYSVMVFIEERNRWGYNVIPGMGYMYVDAEGRHITTKYLPDVTVSEESYTDVNEMVWVHAKAAFYAIALMNCRNVAVEVKTTAPRGGKKSRRVGKQHEYRVIHLPRPKVAGAGSSEASGSTKLHTARGHFKTYTADKPLMGKAVGTYYWGWHVRGSKANGEVISSYKVGVS